MGLQFHHVFAGITVGGGHVSPDAAVDCLVVCVEQRAKKHCSGMLGRGLPPLPDGRADGEGIWAGYADDRDTAPQAGGNCCD